VATAAFIPQTANAERVCRQDCVGPVCQERCVETEGVGTDVKSEYRREDEPTEFAALYRIRIFGRWT
jgi:hypothetical protein